MLQWFYQNREVLFMRIGEVSRRYHISVDNLYYYINYGLLVPPKPRGQYVFD